jgi:hypothetical protein
LGRSVFGVQPGTEGPVLDLFESFEEVAFYRFTGWLPVRMWQLPNRKPLIVTSSLIARFGYLSVLLTTAWGGGSVSHGNLVDSGFDAEYIAAASNYLQKHGLLGSKPEAFYCTPRGTVLAQTLLPVVERNGTV